MLLYLPTPTRRAFLASAATLATRTVLRVLGLRTTYGALALAALAGFSVSSAALADGDARRGAQVYRACVACHALEPGLHLSGPSLDGFIGRMAGTAEGFVRYSTGLRDAGFSWNAAALDGWLKDPAA